MPINGEAIFETRPWKTFGESPATANATVKSDLFNEDQLKFTPEDIRFTQTKDGKTLYAIALGAPTGAVKIKTLAGEKIGSISLLGSDAKLEWKQEADALVIQPPAKWPSQHAVAFKIQMAHPGK